MWGRFNSAPTSRTTQMIILSELWSKSLDILSVFRYCVSLIGARRLHACEQPSEAGLLASRIGGDTRERLLQALHQRFFREAECADKREKIEELRRELREQLDLQNREKLLKLVDLGIELREETSLASFMAGFKLAWGLAQELEADGLYSFEDEEEARACRRAEEV